MEIVTVKIPRPEGRSFSEVLIEVTNTASVCKERSSWSAVGAAEASGPAAVRTGIGGWGARLVTPQSAPGTLALREASMAQHSSVYLALGTKDKDTAGGYPDALRRNFVRDSSLSVCYNSGHDRQVGR